MYADAADLYRKTSEQRTVTLRVLYFHFLNKGSSKFDNRFKYYKNAPVVGDVITLMLSLKQTLNEMNFSMFLT